MKEFASSSEKLEWIDRVLLDVREGEAEADDIDALRALLSKDREARRHYLKSNQLDFILASHDGEERMSGAATVSHFKNMRSYLVGGLIGAGAAALIALVMTRTTDDEVPAPGSGVASFETPPVASLVAEYEAVFQDGMDVKSEELREGEVALDQGLAELVFRNGARVVLEGKCGFEIVDAMTVVLNHGKLWAHCPPEAYGFKVLTPGGHEIIDLGTEFGVEVNESGKTDVHVFYGLVEVKKDSVDESRKVGIGDALSWAKTSSDEEFITTNFSQADESKFVSSSGLNHRRFKNYQARMLERDDLVLYYNFSEIEDGIVHDLSAKAKSENAGKVTRLIPVTGRFDNSRALLFDDPEARIDLDIPSNNRESGSFTVAMWTNVDRLDSTLSVLINSNGWRTGDTHVHIVRNGALRVGVMGIGDFETSVSGIVRPGNWQLVGVIWDSEKREFNIYCDGRTFDVSQRRETENKRIDVQPGFGDCRIGSWDDKGRSYTPPADERAFKGRIDEVMVFDKALSDDELNALYASGKP